MVITIYNGKNQKNVPYLKRTQVVLTYFNIVNDDYQQKSLFTFVPNKSFGQLLDSSPKNFVF